MWGDHTDRQAKPKNIVMAVRFYLNQLAVSKVTITPVPESSSTSAHTLVEFQGERLGASNGEYYFQDFGCILKCSTSSDFMKNISRVTATYSAPEGSAMRESGIYQGEGAEAIVEPETRGSMKRPYLTYYVTVAATSLDPVKKLLLKIIEGSIRPVRSLHGPQGGMPLVTQEKIIKEQNQVISDLTDTLAHSRRVIDGFNAVYLDYQRMVQEQREVIDSMKKK